MLIHFKNILETEFTDLKEKEIFLALSGGKDSMALSHLLLQCGYKHTLLHCNFKLRGADSDLDEKFVLDYANKHNLPIFTQSFNTKKLATTLNLTIQQTARKLRYDWFDTFVVHPNQVLLSAHHLSDSIETFFINLMRGTSIKGLGGISQKRGCIRRPLHNFTSEQIQNYIAQNKILFREDSSNAENKYLRNNLRNNVIPSFNSITSNFTKKWVGPCTH